MNYTKNLNLKKPGENDYYDIDNHNDNYDAIDAAIGKIKAITDNIESDIPEIKAINKEVVSIGETVKRIKEEITEVNANAELIEARGNEKFLGNRLDKFDEQLDNMTIQVDNNTTELLNVVRHIDGYINVKSFKCDDGQYVLGDGIHDDTSGIKKAIATGKPLYYPLGRYILTEALVINNSANWFSLCSHNGYQPILLFEGSGGLIINAEKTTINGITILGNTTNAQNVGIEINKITVELNDVNVLYFDIGIKFKENCWLCTISKCKIEHNNTGIKTNNNCNLMRIMNCYIHLNKIGIDVFGTTENGGSPFILIHGCDIEDNTTYGINIRGSYNNEVFIDCCYFEDHYGWSIFGSQAQASPTKGAKYLSVSNCRFYVGQNLDRALYLYWLDKVSFNNVIFETYNNTVLNQFISIGANTKKVDFSGCTFIPETIAPFNSPEKVSVAGVVVGDKTNLPKITGIGSFYYDTSNPVKGFDSLYLFDGTNWKNKNGDVVTS